MQTINGTIIAQNGLITNYTDSIPYLQVDQGVAAVVTAAQLHDIQVLQIMTFVVLVVMLFVQYKTWRGSK